MLFEIGLALLAGALSLAVAAISASWAGKRHHHWKAKLTLAATVCLLLGLGCLLTYSILPESRNTIRGIANTAGSIGSNSGVIAPGAAGPIIYNNYSSSPKRQIQRLAWWQGTIPAPGSMEWADYVAKKHEYVEQNKLTLHDLYLVDFVYAKDIAYTDYDVLKNAQGQTVMIQKTVLLDMDHGSRSVALYLPYWGDTYGVAALMVGRVKPLLSMWAKFVATTEPIGDAQILSSKDVPFDHRVYFYSEKELTAIEIGELAALYKKHGLEFLPRSQSYLSIKKMELQLRKSGLSP